ncbi:hypothetical protein RBU13_30820, partial [Pseudomonas aeruginosa]
MKTRTSRLFRLSALAAGLCLAQAAHRRLPDGQSGA